MKRARSHSRTATTLTANLENRLLSYATAAAGAAGVSLLALAQPSEAKVVFTPTHQTIARNVLYTLDLNNDGIGDFTISNIGTDFDITRNTNGSSYTSVFMRAYALGKSNRVWGAGGFQSALSKGVTLSSKGQFNQSGGLMGHVYSRNGFGPTYKGPWAPKGATVTNKFIGIKFVISGQVHYGWARFDVRLRNAETGGAGHALLTGYAYESVANKPILTGKTTGPDVVTMPPVSLGNLALGAVRHSGR
jgi:hypothetical protein